MRRVALLAIGAVAIVAILVVAVSGVVSADTVKNRITQDIAALTGRDVTLKGTPVLTIYPSLSITVGDLTVANPPGMSGEPLLTSESMTAGVRLLPLLFGDVEIDTIELNKPRFHLVANAEGRANWTIGGSGADPALGAVQHLKINTGTIVYDDAASHHEELTELDFDGQWGGPGTPLVGNGEVRWRGELLEFNGQIGEPLALAGGGPSPLRLAVAGKPIRLSFNGSTGTATSGMLSINTPALRRIIEWLGKPMGSGSTLGAASINGRVEWRGKEITLADTTLDLDGSSAAGAFTVNLTGSRPLVVGTLTATKLDLSPYVEAIRSGIANDAGVLLAPLSLPVADAIDFDLNLSAQQVVVASVHVDNVAGSIAAMDGRVTLKVDQANFYGGAMTGDVTVALADDTLSARARARASLFGAQAALRSLAGVQALEGLSNVDIDISTRGASLGEVVQRLSGRGTYAVTQGAIAGLDLAQLSALTDGRADVQPSLDDSLEFAQLTGTASLDGGVLRTNDLVMRGDGFRIDLNGWGSVINGVVDARATLSPASADAHAPLIPIVISGTWRRPAFNLDRDRLGPSGGPLPRG